MNKSRGPKSLRPKSLRPKSLPKSLRPKSRRHNNNKEPTGSIVSEASNVNTDSYTKYLNRDRSYELQNVAKLNQQVQNKYDALSDKDKAGLQQYNKTVYDLSWDHDYVSPPVPEPLTPEELDKRMSESATMHNADVDKELDEIDEKRSMHGNQKYYDEMMRKYNERQNAGLTPEQIEEKRLKEKEQIRKDFKKLNKHKSDLFDRAMTSARTNPSRIEELNSILYTRPTKPFILKDDFMGSPDIGNSDSIRDGDTTPPISGGKSRRIFRRSRKMDSRRRKRRNTRKRT